MVGAFRQGLRWCILALVLAAMVVAGAGEPAALPPAPVERLALHPEGGSTSPLPLLPGEKTASAFIEGQGPPGPSQRVAVQVDLGAAPAGRYALLLRADGLTLEERVVVLSGEPRTVVLYAPTGAREVWVNSILAVEGAPGPAVETPEAPPWHPPLWLYPLAGVPLLLALGPRLRRLREKWWMETRHPAEYAAHRSLRRFEHTWSERYVQMARLARNLERLETPRPAAAG